MSQRILIVDDEYATSRMYGVILGENGFSDYYLCEDSRHAMSMIEEHDIDLVLTDLIMPHLDGRELLMQIGERYPNIPVIILTAQDRVETAVECMRFGAFDFMTKPVDANRLLSAIQHGFTIRELKTEVSILSSERTKWQLSKPEVFEPIVTGNSKMHKIFAYMEAIVQSPKSVLITGESGTGKELIARALHQLRNPPGTFVAVNVSGLDDTMFTDSLFGHKKGSFTGADQERKGLVEKAANGTLFLDEIGDLQPQSQIKLLRLLQEGEYYPLGADSPEKSSAKIIIATNADLYANQLSGEFRRDLYYRLIAHHIEIPPLRERTDDIPLLADFFLREAQSSMDRSEVSAPRELYSLLENYDFPGNVRELQGLMYDIVSSSKPGTVELDGLIDYLDQRSTRKQNSNGSGYGENAGGEHLLGPEGMMISRNRLPSMRDVEDFLYSEALRRTDGNQSQAARLLNVSQSTLSRWRQQQDKNP